MLSNHEEYCSTCKQTLREGESHYHMLPISNASNVRAVQEGPVPWYERKRGNSKPNQFGRRIALNRK